MKTTNRLSRFFGVLGLLLILAALAVSFLSLNAPARLLVSPKEANARTEALMEAICQGDLAAAGTYLYGQPKLSEEAQPQEGMEQLLWEGLRSSYDYTFSGDCQASGSGLVREVTITALDIPALMAELQSRAQGLLDTAAKAAVDPDTVYEDDGSYREDFVLAQLRRETKRLLESGQYRAQKTISLSLVCRKGQWWVVSSQSLLDVLSGDLS